MPRPKKNNADYFSHDAGLRDHRKVKALRNKFGSVLGYAFWCMMLEWLTEHDGLEWEYSEIECEMFASELGVSAAEIRSMVDYCLKMELLFITSSGFVFSESLNERLSIVFDKRQRERDRSKTRERREDGTFIPTSTGESAAETTQYAAEIPKSKVKERKVKESKGIHTSTSVDSSVFKNKSLLERSSNFRSEVLELGKETYTPQMLENFIGHWSQPVGAKQLKMKFEKERDSKGWDLNLRLKKWANNNFDKIPCLLTDLKTIDEKKAEFKTLLAPHLEKYSKDILNSFYRHWSQPENKPVPTKLRWEDEEHWDMAARLKTWSQSSFNKKPEESYKIPQ